jgi:hypothetical protein
MENTKTSAVAAGHDHIAGSECIADEFEHVRKHIVRDELDGNGEEIIRLNDDDDGIVLMLRYYSDRDIDKPNTPTIVHSYAWEHDCRGDGLGVGGTVHEQVYAFQIRGGRDIEWPKV